MTRSELVDLAYDFLAAIKGADRDPLTGAKITTAFGKSPDGERYVSLTLDTDPCVCYVINSRGRTWKLVERRGRVDQYVWHVNKDGGDSGWVLTAECPPFETERN